MLEHDSFDAWPSLVGCFKDLVAMGVEVPAAGKVFEELSSIDLGGLSLAGISYFVSSPFT